MSNKIGDYVHLFASNYLKYGTYSPRNRIIGGGGDASFNSTLKMIQNTIASFRGSKVSPTILTTLEQGYSMLNDLDTTVSLADGDVTASEIYKARVEKDLGESNIGQYTYDFKKGVVHYSGKGQGVAEVSAHNYTTESGKRVQGFDAKEINSKLDQLSQILQATRGQLDADEAQELAERIKFLRQEIQEDYQNINGILFKRNGVGLRQKNITLNATRGDINALIKKIARIPAILLAEGNLFETRIQAIPLIEKIGGVGGAVIEKTFNDMLTTVGNTPNVRVTSTPTHMFAHYLVDGKSNLDNRSFMETSTNIVQGKTDVILHLEGQDVNISAKSYKFYNGGYTNISVGSNASLLTALNDLGGNFINHYLNVFARRIGAFNDVDLSGYRSNLVNPIKQYLFYKELTGSYSNRSTINGRSDIPDVLAINNKTDGGARFIAIDDILKVVLDNPNLISVNPKIQDLRFNNTFVPTWDKKAGKEGVYGAAYQRIANLIMEAHTTKIHVGFNFNWNGTY